MLTKFLHRVCKDRCYLKQNKTKVLPLTSHPNPEKNKPKNNPKAEINCFMGMGFLFQNLQADGTSTTSFFLLKAPESGFSRSISSQRDNGCLYLCLLKHALLNRCVSPSLCPQKGET